MYYNWYGTLAKWLKTRILHDFDKYNFFVPQLTHLYTRKFS